MQHSYTSTNAFTNENTSKKKNFIDNIKNDELKESEEESVEDTYGGIDG